MSGYKLLVLEPNGDPYGKGFVAHEYPSWPNRELSYYRGDLGAQSREWFRRYAKKNNFRLSEYRA